MDPDLDPNLQHWQDRFDNFQWVVGSLVSRARQHPDLTPPAPATDRRRVVVLTLLAIDGVLSAIAAAFFLPRSYRNGAVSHQRAAERSAQRGTGVGGAAMDVGTAAGRTAACGAGC